MDYQLGIDVDPAELIALRWHARPFALTSKRRVASAVSGLHASRFRGRGVDYLESRNYQHGDDIRNMDWRVTARTGKAHTKIYQEERERPVLLMLDLNGSMFFGTRTRLKSVAAAQVAALFSWATTGRGDRIGALAFGDGDFHESRPTGGRRGAMAMIRSLSQWYQPVVRPTTGHGLGVALERVRRVLRPGSMVVLISDFYSCDDTVERHLNRIRQHNDMLAIRVHDRLEEVAPPPGRYTISDGVKVGTLKAGTAQRRQDYQAWFAERRQQVADLLTRRNIPLIDIDSGLDPVEQLMTGFRVVGQ